MVSLSSHEPWWPRRPSLDELGMSFGGGEGGPPRRAASPPGCLARGYGLAAGFASSIASTFRARLISSAIDRMSVRSRTSSLHPYQVT